MLDRIRNFRLEWKITLFTLLMFPLFIRLGLWQLDREDEKLAIQQTWETRQQAAPASLESLEPRQDLQYALVEMRGRFDNERAFLLDNRVWLGRTGFEVISPFITETGRTVLVNRGWAPQGPYRSDLPEIPAVEGGVEITGTVYQPLGEQMTLGREASFDGWPHVVQTLEPAAMYRMLDAPMEEGFPYSVRLEEGEPGVLTRNWTLVSTSPQKHRGYAIQWFAMAAMLLVLFFYVSTQPARHGSDE